MKKIVGVIGRLLIVILITVIFIAITLIGMIKLICSDISKEAKQLFATTMLETGQMKFVVSLFLSNDEIRSLVNQNSVQAMSTEVDTSLIETGESNKNEEGFDSNRN